MDFDLGDMIASFNIRVKGRRRRWLVWHIGATAEHDPDGQATTGMSPQTQEASTIMDLQADKQVPLSVALTDEMGNPVPVSEKFVAVYTIDDPSVITLVDNGDGTATASAVGGLGTATVHVSATVDGQEMTGDLAIVVVAGLAERLTVTAGEPVEVTPDDIF